MSLIKKLVTRNAYLAEGLYSICAKKYNNKMTGFVNEISDIDSIENVDYFFDKMRDLPESWHNTFTNFKNSYAENTLYGYANEVMHYAGIDEKDIFYMPLLEHGISYNGNLELTRYNIHRPYFFQGRSCEKQWKNISSKEAYYIGPFIHYAAAYYDDFNFLRLKESLGKTALVFLPHSVEFDCFTLHVDEIVNKYISHSSANVDTVLICVYYTDLTKELIRSVEAKENFKLVCAGFKLDPLFVRRLKSILQLSDICFFNSFSTSIGYAYYLNKQIVPDISDDEKKRFHSIYGERGIWQLERFEQCFSADDEDTKYAFVDELWGLSETKTSKQIFGFFEEAKRQMIRNMGF